MENNDNNSIEYNDLNDTWTFWVHLPHDINWDINSYKKIYDFDKLQHGIALIENIQESLVTNCMLFIMRKDIQPIWEDKNNINGGCISYKINNKMVYQLWKHMCYLLIGENLSSQESMQKKINGITISPKKNFCIIKIWFNSCDKSVKDFNNNNNIENISDFEGIFKKHIN